METPATPASAFDKIVGSLTGRPDVIKTAPTTQRLALPMIGGSQVYIVQTFRDPEEGDTILVEYLDAAGPMRLALLPRVSAIIARQRDALTTTGRKRRAKAAAEDRKRKGIEPAFLKGKRGEKPGKKSLPVE